MQFCLVRLASPRDAVFCSTAPEKPIIKYTKKNYISELYKKKKKNRFWIEKKKKNRYPIGIIVCEFKSAFIFFLSTSVLILVSSIKTLLCVISRWSWFFKTLAILECRFASKNCGIESVLYKITNLVTNWFGKRWFSIWIISQLLGVWKQLAQIHNNR